MSEQVVAILRKQLEEDKVILQACVDKLEKFDQIKEMTDEIRDLLQGVDGAVPALRILSDLRVILREIDENNDSSSI